MNELAAAEKRTKEETKESIRKRGREGGREDESGYEANPIDEREQLAWIRNGADAVIAFARLFHRRAFPRQARFNQNERVRRAGWKERERERGYSDYGREYINIGSVQSSQSFSQSYMHFFIHVYILLRTYHTWMYVCASDMLPIQVSSIHTTKLENPPVPNEQTMLDSGVKQGFPLNIARRDTRIKREWTFCKHRLQKYTSNTSPFVFNENHRPRNLQVGWKK